MLYNNQRMQEYFLKSCLHLGTSNFLELAKAEPCVCVCVV